jgi:hypothetical protein
VRNPRRAALLLIILLVDVGIVLFALHLHKKDHEAPPPTTAIVAPSTLPVQTPTAPPTLTTTKSAADVSAATTTSEPILSVLGARIAWRALGYCQPGAFYATTDSASTFTNLKPPSAYVLYIHLTGPKSGWVVGANSTCTSLDYYVTHNSGADWKQVRSLGRIWIPLPIGIEGPSGHVSRPCGSNHPAPISFSSAGVAGDAVAVCRRGVFRSTNGGASWKPTGPVTPGKAAGVALAKDGNGVLIMTHDQQCQGARILQTTDSGASWSVGSCLRIVEPPVAIALAGNGQGLLITLTSRYRTIDFGRTWD